MICHENSTSIISLTDKIRTSYFCSHSDGFRVRTVSAELVIINTTFAGMSGERHVFLPTKHEPGLGGPGPARDRLAHIETEHEDRPANQARRWRLKTSNNVRAPGSSLT